ncbi:unnamed protein product, partial [Discosporangium mesarthrocarpum]
VVGLLGEYLEGSPLLSDLLALWDLPLRKSVVAIAAAHTEALAAVLDCLAGVVAKGISALGPGPDAAEPCGTRARVGGKAGPAGAGAGAGGGSVVEGAEATGLGLCRRIIRERFSQLCSQLGPTSNKDKGEGIEEDQVVATLRLLVGIVRFHRLAAKEVMGCFDFNSKAFLSLMSRKGVGTLADGTVGGQE